MKQILIYILKLNFFLRKHRLWPDQMCFADKLLVTKYNSVLDPFSGQTSKYRYR